MARKSQGGSYPVDWKAIATRTKDESGWCCVRCGAPHVNRPGYTLTVHHLDMNPANCRWWNLAALCCKCHLQIQHKVILDRPWVMQEHTPWFRPYVAGYYAFKYLGEELTRAETVVRLDELLGVERRVVLGVA